MTGPSAIPSSPPIAQIERDTLATLSQTSWRYWLGLAAAVGVTVLGGWCWSQMLRQGMGVTGLNAPVMWGSLITTFVFFIGVSTRARWCRRSCTSRGRRCAPRSGGRPRA